MIENILMLTHNIPITFCLNSWHYIVIYRLINSDCENYVAQTCNIIFENQI